MSVDDVTSKPPTLRIVEPASEQPGGDPACWLARVCDECGALVDDESATECWKCKTPWAPR